MALYSPTYSSDRFDIFNYIEDYDVFNSELMMRLTVERNTTEYKITKYAGRIDLLTKVIFNDYSSCMAGLITLFTDSTDYALGETINYLSEIAISSLLSQLNYK